MSLVAAFAVQLGWHDGLFSGDDDADDQDSGQGFDYGALSSRDAINDARGDFLSDLAQDYNGTSAADAVNVIGAETGFEFTMRGGDDTVIGSRHADDVVLGAGNDNASLADGDDIAQGGAGNDNIFGGTGNDTVSGGRGDDWLQGHGDDDWLFGDGGDDVIEGGYGDDNIFGGAGDDRLTGDAFGPAGSIERGIDSIFGGAGDDEIHLGDGDTGTGGYGEDMFFVFDIPDADAEAAHITDFDAEKDSLTVHYDEKATPRPELMVEYDAEFDETLVRLNGLVVASMDGLAEVTAEDITLTPMSD
ncbi:MAG: calcium-binding protein [Maritimibacter sp.]